MPSKAVVAFLFWILTAGGVVGWGVGLSHATLVGSKCSYGCCTLYGTGTPEGVVVGRHKCDHYFDQNSTSTYIFGGTLGTATGWTGFGGGGGGGNVTTADSPTANQIVKWTGSGQAVTFSTCTATATPGIDCPANAGAGGLLRLKELTGGGSNTWSIDLGATNLSSDFSITPDTSGKLNAGSLLTAGTFPLVERVWLPAAGCNNATASTFWDLPTATPAVAACVTGTNTQKGVLDYADTAGGFSAQTTLILPADWTTTGGMDISLYWTTTATSGNAKWSVSTICTDVAATATDDPAFNTANTVTTAAPGTSPRVQVSSITGLTLTSCTTATNMILHLKVFRDGNDGADTITATARLIGAMLTFRRNV